MSHTTITAELELFLALDGSMLSVPASLVYDANDAYAVRVTFHTGPTDTVEWVFARSLLTEGVAGPTGEGDIRLRPLGSGRGATVVLELSSPSGEATFEVSRDALVEFLMRSYEVVPTGHESELFDLDAELALLMWESE